MFVKLIALMFPREIQVSVHNQHGIIRDFCGCIMKTKNYKQACTSLLGVEHSLFYKPIQDKRARIEGESQQSVCRLFIQCCSEKINKKLMGLLKGEFFSMKSLFAEMFQIFFQLWQNLECACLTILRYFVLEKSSLNVLEKSDL